jgi:hypothetical protein
MGREDIDVSQEMRRILANEGIQAYVTAELLNVKGRSGDKVSLLVRTASGEQKIDGSDILVAAGRVANTTGIGLEQTGVKLDGRGYIRVNDRLETSAAGIWAMGECAGSPQFTHVSEDDFRIIRDNLSGGNRSTRDRLIPYCMFTDPPLAHVGLSEGEAGRQGIIVRIGRLPGFCAAGAGDRRETRFHESSCRRERRSHSRLHDDWRCGWRSDGRRANGDGCRRSLREACECCARAPDDGGGTEHAACERAAPLRSARHARKSGVEIPSRAAPTRPCAFDASPQRLKRLARNDACMKSVGSGAPFSTACLLSQSISCVRAVRMYNVQDLCLLMLG